MVWLAVIAALASGPAKAQKPDPQWRVAKLSDLGCPRDGVTDATDCVNGFLAQASAASPVKLVLDGTVAMQGLVISPRGQTWIEGLGWDTGIVIEAKSNQDGIRIGPYTGGYTEGQEAALPARSATNIILSNFTVDANGDANATGGSRGLTPNDVPFPGAKAHPIFGVILTNATGILIDHVQFLRPPMYCLTFANDSGITVRDSSFITDAILRDGVHVDGPAENIRILNNFFATGDDGIALNAPEGYGGDIADVLVDGNTFRDAFRVVRLYTSDKAQPNRVFSARRILISHNTGTAHNVAFYLGLGPALFAATPDQIKDVSIEDNDISSPEGFALVNMPFGSLRLQGNTYDAPTAAVPLLQVLEPGGGDSELTDNIILRNADGNASPPLASVASGATLGRLTLTGNRVVDGEASAYPPIPYLVDIAGSVGMLRLDSADLGGVSALLNPATGFKGIGSVSGPGIMSTGVEIPDAAMADGSAYVSATGPRAGQPCVKLQGKVKPL